MNPLSPLLRAAAPALLLSLSAAAAFAAPLQVDPAALALLQKVQVTSQKMHSLSADVFSADHFQDTGSSFRHVGSLQLMKPNYGREQHWIVDKNKTNGSWVRRGSPTIFASDGRNNWRLLSNGEYTKASDDSQGSDIAANTLTGDFFDLSKSVLARVHKQAAKGQLLALTYLGAQTWEGRPCQVVEWKYKPDFSFPDSIRKTAPSEVVIVQEQFYIGSDNLVYHHKDAYNIGWSFQTTLRNVRINPVLTAANFKLTLPPGAHLPKPPLLPKPLLAVGTPAPDFAATAPDGSTVHLSDFKGKTVVLDFWSTWCGPCQMSMPHLEKVYQAVKDKNVAVLGVCVWDKKTEYDKWVVAKKETYHFPTAFDPAANQEDSIASKLYHVSGIPTQYVIDKDGKIAASTVGYDEKGTALEDALRKQGMPETETAAKP